TGRHAGCSEPGQRTQLPERPHRPTRRSLSRRLVGPAHAAGGSGTPTLTFVSNLAGNPVGGMRHGFTDADNLGLNLNFELDKLYGPRGASFVYSMSQRSGANLSAIDVGNTFTIQQVYGRETWQVIDIAYLQKFLDDRVELRIGRIAAGDV